jgi:hypothetical protein
MHTAQFARRRGVGTAMLKHIIAAAQTSRCSRLSLETGSSDYFKPARALYRTHGFVAHPSPIMCSTRTAYSCRSICRGSARSREKAVHQIREMTS